MRLLAAALVLLSACGPPPSPSESPRAARIIDARTGEALSFESLLERLEPARVVYVGERHDNAGDHRAQAAIADALLAGGAPAALGFEMFSRPAQPALDAFAASEIEEGELLERVEWDSRWGFDYAFYRPLVAHSRAPSVRALALNAPREITRAIGRGGLEALDDADREALPELDRDVAAHRAMIEAAFAHHPHMDPERLERFYSAQLVWDETMAEGVADALGAEPAPERVLVFAGAMHVRRSAIPSRAARRAPHEYAIVLPASADEVAELRAGSPPIADFLWVGE